MAQSNEDAGLVHLTHGVTGGYSAHGQALADNAKKVFGFLKRSHPPLPTASAPVGAEEINQYKMFAAQLGK